MEVRMCNKCGSPIPPQRLQALPETKCCIGCSCERCRTVLDIEVAGPDSYELAKNVMDIPRGQ